jgi:hypothetical protein
MRWVGLWFLCGGRRLGDAAAFNARNSRVPQARGKRTSLTGINARQYVSSLRHAAPSSGVQSSVTQTSSGFIEPK